MSDPQICETDQGRRIAYRKLDGDGPTIVFSHGLRSDMEGTKSVFLEERARARGQAFLRFDCSGHGLSSGVFEQGCIGDWAEDATAVITKLTTGQVILVGSSMGGWLSLLLARAMPERIAGLVTIAAAPDFTEDGYWNGFSETQKAELETVGHVALPSDYGDPMIVSMRLIEDGRKHLVLRSPLSLPFPTRFLQGAADEDVDVSVALRLLTHADGGNIQLSIVKGADHRFSEPAQLDLIATSVEQVISERPRT